MNALPVVTVSRVDGGHLATCTCGWVRWDISRVTVDLVARRHRATHGKAA